MDWKRLLAYITGSVDQELLLRNEYLRCREPHSSKSDQRALAAVGWRAANVGRDRKQLGKKALEEVANIVRPETILGWHRKLLAKKFDGSKNRRSPGRPRIDADIEELVLRFAKENKSWGYDRIVGALADLGHEVSDQTVGNILKRHG